MIRTIWLVRHPPVALAWQKRCYGQSDPGLSREGARQAKEIATRLISFSPQLVIHSGMRRTRAVAELLGSTGLPFVEEPLWRERHFGDWEGRSWQTIYKATGSAMDGMLTNPDTFRPGDGETTAELFKRVEKAWADLPAVSRIAVISHGGPIACARALEQDLNVSALAELIPMAGESILLQA